MEIKQRFELRKIEQDGDVYHAARCRPLGLTAYGDTPLMAIERLKKMFGLLVDTAMSRLNSQLGSGEVK